MTDHTKPSAETREADEDAIAAPHEAGRAASSDESAAAEQSTVDADVKEHYREMTQKGAHQKGEGRIG